MKKPNQTQDANAPAPVTLDDVKKALDAANDWSWLKPEILAHRDTFASFGFYMPEFDEAVSEMDFIEAKGARKFYAPAAHWFWEDIAPLLNGEGTTQQAAQRLTVGRQKSLFERLLISPNPKAVIQAERAEMGHFFDLTRERKNKSLIEGYHALNTGYSISIKEVFWRAVLTKFENSHLRAIYDDDTINPSILNDRRAGYALSSVIDTIQGAFYAHWEPLLIKIEGLLSAGKTIAEIRAALFPENDGEGNLITPATAAPETPVLPAALESDNEAQRPDFTPLEMALLYFYQKKPMTRETAAEIAGKCVKPDGSPYSVEYVFKLVRVCADDGTRRQHRKGKEAKKNRLQIIENLRQYVPETRQLEEDIRRIRDAKKRPKK